jgi:hypothetical protein
VTARRPAPGSTNADRIHREFQEWRPGQKLMYTPDRLGGRGHALVVLLDSGRALGFATRQVGTPPSAPYDGSWSFVLEPIDGRSTRFLVRGAADGKRSIAGSLFDHVIFDPVHFVMERKMMEGMKLRAEGGHPAADADVAQVVLWTIAFALMVASAVLVFRRESWMGPLSAFVVAAAVFQIPTFAQHSRGARRHVRALARRLRLDVSANQRARSSLDPARLR